MGNRNWSLILIAILLAVSIFQCVQTEELKEKIQRLENETQEAIRSEANNLRAELKNSIFEIENFVLDFNYSLLAFDNESKKATACVKFSLKEYKEDSKIVLRFRNYENDGKGDCEVSTLKTGLNTFIAEVKLDVQYDYVCDMYDVSSGAKKLNTVNNLLPLKSEYDNRIITYLNGSHDNTLNGITSITSEIRNNTFGNDMLRVEKAQLVIRMAENEVFVSDSQIEVIEFADGVECFKVVSQYEQSVLKENKKDIEPTPEPQYFIRLTLKNGETYDVST